MLDTISLWTRRVSAAVEALAGNVSLRLGDQRGATRASVQNDTGAEVAYIDSVGGASFARLGATRMDIARRLRAGTPPDYLYVGSDGTLRLFGAATTWLDEKGQLSGAKVVSPSSKIVQDDAEAAFYWKDTATTSDYLWTNVQQNHDRKLASVLKPHLHWWQTSATIPNWLLQCRWQVQGQSKTTAWASLQMLTHAFTYVSGTLDQISEFGTIAAPSGDGVSGILQVRIIRDTTNLSGLFSGVDGLVGNVYAYDFDTHKECDALGSASEYHKYQPGKLSDLPWSIYQE